MFFEREGHKRRKQTNLCVFTPFWFWSSLPTKTTSVAKANIEFV